MEGRSFDGIRISLKVVKQTKGNTLLMLWSAAPISTLPYPALYYFPAVAIDTCQSLLHNVR